MVVPDAGFSSASRSLKPTFRLDTALKSLERRLLLLADPHHMRAPRGERTALWQDQRARNSTGDYIQTLVFHAEAGNGRQEAHGVRMLGVLQDADDVALLDYLPRVHDDH